MSALTYQIGNALYLNITNRCTNACSFCIRYLSQNFNGAHPLWLNREPNETELLEEIGDASRFDEIVFCGYGEPLIRLDLVKSLARKILITRKANRSITQDNKSEILPKSFPLPTIRVNTNGSANLFHQRNILPELSGLIDAMQISLNAENAEKYAAICHPAYGKMAYPALLAFAREAKKYIPTVVLTVVALPAIDIPACQKIADSLGLTLRVRPYYKERYKK